MNDSDYYGSGSLETTFACERARLVRLCAKFTGDGDVAEDLAQETLFEAWRHIHNLHSQDRVLMALRHCSQCLPSLGTQARTGSPSAC
jgi:biotin synthase-related radical SAM superfamily protein